MVLWDLEPCFWKLYVFQYAIWQLWGDEIVFLLSGAEYWWPSTILWHLAEGNYGPWLPTDVIRTGKKGPQGEKPSCQKMSKLHVTCLSKLFLASLVFKKWSKLLWIGRTAILTDGYKCGQSGDHVCVCRQHREDLNVTASQEKDVLQMRRDNWLNELFLKKPCT